MLSKFQSKSENQDHLHPRIITARIHNHGDNFSHKTINHSTSQLPFEPCLPTFRAKYCAKSAPQKLVFVVTVFLKKPTTLHNSFSSPSSSPDNGSKGEQREGRKVNTNALCTCLDRHALSPNEPTE